MPLIGTSNDVIRPGDYTFFGNGRRTRGSSGAYAPKTAMEGLGQQIDSGIGRLRSEAERLRAEEERRGASAQRTIEDAAARADVPTVTQRDIDRRFSTEAAASTRDRRENLRSFRDFMGASGVTGGGQVSAAASNLELSRLAAVTRSRSDLAAFKLTQDALDRQRQFDRSQVVAGIQNRPVSMLGADAIAQELQVRVGQLGAQAEIDAAKAGASAAKSSGKSSLIGSIISGGFGLVGSLL